LRGRGGGGKLINGLSKALGESPRAARQNKSIKHGITVNVRQCSAKNKCEAIESALEKKRVNKSP
jgi:hypothetical protein